MCGTQVWCHKNVRPMSNVNCTPHCVTQVYQCTPVRGSFTSSLLQIIWLIILPWTCLMLLILLLTLGTFHLVTAFLFLAYIMPAHFVAQSPCLFWLSYLRPWLIPSCQPTTYFVISWSCLQLYLSMVTCLHFWHVLPSKAWAAAFCCCFRKGFEGYPICLILGLFQALLSSLLGGAHLVLMFFHLVIALLGCSIKQSRLWVLLPIFSVQMGRLIVILHHQTFFSSNLIFSSRCSGRPMSQRAKVNRKQAALVTWPCPFLWLLLLSVSPVREAVT